MTSPVEPSINTADFDEISMLAPVLSTFELVLLFSSADTYLPATHMLMTRQMISRKIPNLFIPSSRIAITTF